MNPLHPALQAVYADRLIEPGDINALTRHLDRQPNRPDHLAREYAALYAADFEQRADRLQALRQDRDILRMVDRQHEDDEIETFRFEGRVYDSADARSLLARVERRLEDEERWWADFDRRVFVVHYRMARDLGESVAQALQSHYAFHLALQNIDCETSRRRRIVSRVAAFVNETDGPIDYADFQDVRETLSESYEAFEKCLRVACRLRPPQLRCLPEDQPVANALLSEALPPRLRPVARSVSGRWIRRFGRQLDEVRTNARRIQVESLDVLLQRQASIARRWAEAIKTLPEAVPAEDEPPRARRKAADEPDLQPLEGEEEYELSEEDVLTPTEEIRRPDAELDEEPVGDEFALTERDVLAESEKAGPDVDMDDIDPDDHSDRPRHWKV